MPHNKGKTVAKMDRVAKNLSRLKTKLRHVQHDCSDIQMIPQHGENSQRTGQTHGDTPFIIYLRNHVQYTKKHASEDDSECIHDSDDSETDEEQNSRPQKKLKFTHVSIPACAKPAPAPCTQPAPVPHTKPAPKSRMTQAPSHHLDLPLPTPTHPVPLPATKPKPKPISSSDTHTMKVAMEAPSTAKPKGKPIDTAINDDDDDTYEFSNLPLVCKVTLLNENFPSWPSLADSAYQQWLQITLVLNKSHANHCVMAAEKWVEKVKCFRKEMNDEIEKGKEEQRMHDNLAAKIDAKHACKVPVASESQLTAGPSKFPGSYDEAAYEDNNESELSELPESIQVTPVPWPKPSRAQPARQRTLLKILNHWILASLWESSDFIHWISWKWVEGKRFRGLGG
ncbi:hypothetical protein BD769DRAFT_1396876 [Suillus cothurnatus]|nr:hypothetical protein BD769DRAFT_1396876 [Suillus cothurnatus]